MPFPLGGVNRTMNAATFHLGNSLCEISESTTQDQKKAEGIASNRRKIICRRAPFYLWQQLQALSSVTPTALQVLDTGLPDSTAACSGVPLKDLQHSPPAAGTPNQDTPSLPRPRAAIHPLGTIPFRPLLLILRETIPPSPPHFPLRVQSLLVSARQP